MLSEVKKDSRIKSIMRSIFNSEDRKDFKEKDLYKKRNLEERKKEERNMARLFLKNYMLKIDINRNRNFQFIDGYKMSSNIDYHYFTLEEKFSYIENLLNLKFDKKLRTLKNSLVAALNNIDDIEKNANALTINQASDLKIISKYLFDLYKLVDSRISYLSESFSSSKFGIDGEAMVNSKLNIHTNIINLHNIRISDSLGRVCQCDNIVISKNGIFVIEVKNYGSQGNYSIKVDSTGRWTKKTSKNIEVLTNPVDQNTNHIAILNKFLADNFRDISVRGIIVIANETVDVINESKDIVVRPSSLYNSIDNYFDARKISDNEILNLRDLLLKANMKEMKYPVFSLEEEFSDENIDKFNFLIEKCNRISKILVQ